MNTDLSPYFNSGSRSKISRHLLRMGEVVLPLRCPAPWMLFSSFSPPIVNFPLGIPTASRQKRKPFYPSAGDGLDGLSGKLKNLKTRISVERGCQSTRRRRPFAVFITHLEWVYGIGFKGTWCLAWSGFFGGWKRGGRVAFSCSELLRNH